MPSFLNSSYIFGMSATLVSFIILGNYGVDNVTDIDARSFWSMVEFDVRSLDDNWVTTGMELGLINNVICVGQVANNNIDIWENNEYIDNKGVRHKGFCIRHFQEEMKRGGVFERISHASGDITTAIQHILDYSERGFLSVVRNPFILDFDLDCFSYNENALCYICHYVLTMCAVSLIEHILDQY